MSALSEPIKCFPDKEEAHEAFILLEAENIPCEAKKLAGNWYYTLFVAQEHSETALHLISHLGFPPSAEKGSETQPQEPKSSAAPSADEFSLIRNAMKSEQKSLGHKLATLFISLLIFAGLGLVNGSPVSLLLLLLVLFIHESGHWLSMKLFGYSDVQMFFIPGFGAAVSGTEKSPCAKKKAIVSLMGPIPGIIIGFGCLIAYLITKINILSYAADLFIMINAFNLLPFSPMDGGRFFEAVLFTRHPRVEVAFKVLAMIALAGIAFFWKSVGLGILAYFVFVSIRHVWTIASVSSALRQELPPEHSYTPDHIPDHFMGKIVARLAPWIPKQQNEIKKLAQSVKSVWSKMIIQHCSIRASIGLTLLYLFFATPALGLLTLSQILAMQQKQEPAAEKESVSQPVEPVSYNIYPAPEQ